MFESLCARAEKYNQGNGTLVHRQVVNAINEPKLKIDRKESLSAADESETIFQRLVLEITCDVYFPPLGSKSNRIITTYL